MRLALDGGSPPCSRRSGGFTMVEVLVTMLILTVSLLGLAGLQVATIHRVTASRRATEASRICHSLVQRYQTTAFGSLPAETSGAWVDTLVNVAGDMVSTGPYTVSELVETTGSLPTHKVVTVRVGWQSQDTAQAAEAAKRYYVTMSARRSQ